MPDIIDVTLITAVYGEDKYFDYVKQWVDAVENLNPKPKKIMVATDNVNKLIPLPLGYTIVNMKDKDEFVWRSPYYWNECARLVDTEWIWVLDIDDTFVSDALTMLNTDKDVVAVGIRIDKDTSYIPYPMNGIEIADGSVCYLNCGSPIRKSWWKKVGGYPDIALTDWGMWRKLARAGATFNFPNKIGYNYRKDNRGSMSDWAETEQNKQDALQY